MDSFGFDNVISNNNPDPDENIFNSLSQIAFYAVEEAATSLKKLNDKGFSVLHLNVVFKSQSKLRIF